eukprot:COSAG01_NODE_6546_length_3613_cov_16.807057_2_plen_197_part_00
MSRWGGGGALTGAQDDPPCAAGEQGRAGRADLGQRAGGGRLLLRRRGRAACGLPGHLVSAGAPGVEKCCVGCLVSAVECERGAVCTARRIRSHAHAVVWLSVSQSVSPVSPLRCCLLLLAAPAVLLASAAAACCLLLRALWLWICSVLCAVCGGRLRREVTYNPSPPKRTESPDSESPAKRDLYFFVFLNMNFVPS